MSNEEANRRKEERIPRQFDLFIKRSLRNITLNVLERYRRDLEKEYIMSIEEMKEILPQNEMHSRVDMIQVRVGNTIIYLEDEELAEAIRKLPKRFLDVIDMKYFQNMEYEDICKMLHLDRNSAQVYASNALRRLKKILKEGSDAKKF